MDIAVNTRFLIPNKIEGLGRVTHEIMSRMVQEHPEHQYHFLFDRKFDPQFIYNENVDPVVLSPPTRHPILIHYWFQTRIKNYLKRTKPKVFFSPDGFMPMQSRIPSVITIHDLAYIHYPDFISRAHLRYYQRNVPRFVHEAAHITTVSEYSKRDICTQFLVPEEKVSVIHNGVSDEFKPLSEPETDKTRRKYSGGKPYFLYVGAIHPRKNIDRLIQAFDDFKQRTGSTKRLLITGRKSWSYKLVEQAYDLAKNRDDILFLGYVSQTELPYLIAGAFALCYVSLFEGFGLPILEAMASGVPVISSNINAMAEVADDAAVLVDPEDVESIAHGLTLLEENSDFYESLVAKGLARKQAFEWDKAAEAYYSVLERFQ